MKSPAMAANPIFASKNIPPPYPPPRDAGKEFLASQEARLAFSGPAEGGARAEHFDFDGRNEAWEK